MSTLAAVRKFLVPALVFQAVLSGGGYASGREMYEYVVRFGKDGVLGIIAIGIGFFAMLFLSAELARTTRSYNYRQWSRQLLGRWWVLFEVVFVAMALVAIAVVASAAADVIRQDVGVPAVVASLLLFLAIGALTTLPRGLLESYESIGTVLLTGMYVIVAISLTLRRPTELAAAVQLPGERGWLLAAALYVGYNLVVIPSCLFTFDTLVTRRDSALAAAVAAILGVVPIVLGFIILVPFRATLADVKVPLFEVIRSRCGIGVIILYHVVLFLTLVDTGVGLLHAILERANDQRRDLGLAPFRRLHAAVGVMALCVLSATLAQIGIIALVAKVYAAMGAAFILVYAVPLIAKSVRSYPNANGVQPTKTVK